MEMIDINKLRKLAQAVSEWNNCNQAWLDQSEDIPAAVVGHIDEDGNTYPVATIDCDQYYAAHQSLPLARFYATANPAAITELLDRLEAAEARLNGMVSEREAALTQIDQLKRALISMTKQEPVASIYIDGNGGREFDDWKCQLPVGSNLLYAIPGAQPAQTAARVKFVEGYDDAD